MRFIKKIKYLNLIFILFAIFLSGCADKEPVSKSGVYFDTIVTITLYGEDDENYAIISAANESIVSSGNYERYFYKDGVLYHHILDTSTGYMRKV